MFRDKYLSHVALLLQISAVMIVPKKTNKRKGKLEFIILMFYYKIKHTYKGNLYRKYSDYSRKEYTILINSKYLLWG